LQPEHCRNIQLRGSDERGRELLEHLFHMERNFEGFAGIEDGKVLGIGGFVFLDDAEEAEGFLALSEEAVEKPIRFHFAIRNKIKEFIQEHPQIRRLKAYVDARYVFERINWILLLGFDEYRGPGPCGPAWATFVMQVKR